MKKIKLLFAGNRNLKIVMLVLIVIALGFLIKVGVRQVKYQNYLEKARESERQEEYVEAVIYYGMASHIKPKQERPYIKMADCYEERSEFDQANAILEIGKRSVKDQRNIVRNQEEIQTFVEEDIDVQDVEIPEYTGSTYLKGEKEVKNFVDEMKTYNGQNGKYNATAMYYKGYLYFAEDDTVYRTRNGTKEKIYSLDQEDYYINIMMIVNNRIVLNNRDKNAYNPFTSELISVRTDGDSLIKYKNCQRGDIGIYKGWIYYKDEIDVWLYDDFDDIYNENIGFSKVSISGKKNQFLQRYRESDDLNECIYGKYAYFTKGEDEKKLIITRKSLDNIMAEEENLLEETYPEGMRLNTRQWMLYDDKILYGFETEDGKTEQWYLYDIGQKSKKKISWISKDTSICNLYQGWIYYYIEMDTKNEEKVKVYKTNGSKTKEIGEVHSNMYGLDICNNKLVFSNDDDKKQFWDIK